MMKKKTYEGRSYLSMNITVKGETRWLEFTKLSNGKSKLTTTDADLIEALDNHPEKGELFKCIEEQEVEAPKKEKEPTKEPETPSTPEGFEVVEGIKSVPAARDYLVSLGADKDALKNKAAVLAEAEKRSIHFISW